MSKVLDFVLAHPARVYAVLVALAACLPAAVAGVPVAALLALAAAILGGGEAVQRTENGKTDQALNTEAPVE